MKNCGSCKGYDLGWCVWKAKRASPRDGGCSWYKEDLDRAMDGAARKKRNGKKADLAARKKGNGRKTDLADRAMDGAARKVKKNKKGKKTK